MAATHTYVVLSAVGFNGIATIIGTVDTIPSTKPIAVTVQVGLQDLLSIDATGGILAAENFVGPIMLSAAISAGLPVPVPVVVSQIPTGTFSQNGHTYVVSSITSIGKDATIVGTVDGITVTITVNISYLLLVLAQGLQALEDVVASGMLQAAVPAGLPLSAVTQLPTGTFTL